MINKITNIVLLWENLMLKRKPLFFSSLIQFFNLINRIMKKSNKILSRRNFLGKVGTATAAFTIIPRHVMAGTGYLQPSDTINVAVIGCGSQGTSDARSLCPPDEAIVRPNRHGRTGILVGDPFYEEAVQRDALRGAPIAPELTPEEDVPSTRIEQSDPSAGPSGAPMGTRDQSAKLANIYALCDVDTEFAGPTFRAYPKAKVYTDWRELLEKEKSNIDAVVIATPDHNHALIAAAFMREKKHIYMQKPMAKTPYECRKLAELAQEYDVVTQQGNQGHATDNTRRCVEWIQSGVIGFVREVHVQGGGPPWPRGYIERPEGIKVPSHINYDLWTGPAPLKPYHPLCFHNQWRALWDYGTGYLGDWIGHHFDSIWWALNLDRPIRVHASSTRFSRDYYPEAEEIIYEFPARGYNPPVKIIWRDGGIKTPRPSEMEQGRRMPTTIFIGDKGILAAGKDNAPSFIPERLDFEGPEPWIPRTGNVFEQWIDCIKSGTKTTNDFSYSSKIIESGLLGNIANLMQNDNIILEYDGARGRFTNSEKANSLLHYEYRKGWTL